MDELDNADNWVQAEIDIETIMGQAIATIPVRKIRLNLENARKQFLLMTQLVARRNANIRQVGAEFESISYHISIPYFIPYFIPYHNWNRPQTP